MENTPSRKDQKSDEPLQKTGSSDVGNGNVKKYATSKTSDSIANGGSYEGHSNCKRQCYEENEKNEKDEKENVEVASTYQSSTIFGKSKNEPEVYVQHGISYAGVTSGSNQKSDGKHLDGHAEETKSKSDSKSTSHSQTNSL